MTPKISLEGDMPTILKNLSHETDSLQWGCDPCGTQRAAPLKPEDIPDVKAYIRRQKKQWWQFWIR
jgi:hypothetical protein